MTRAAARTSASARADAAPSTAWSDAAIAIALLAVDPKILGGVWLRGAASEASQRLVDLLQDLLPPGAPVRKLPANAPDDRLLGGLDLAATLARGRPVHDRGLLAEADGGAIVVSGAERVTPGLAGRIAAALDRGAVAAERDGFGTVTPARFAVLAFDEGGPDDAAPPPALTERLGLVIPLSGLTRADLASPSPFTAKHVAAARDRLAALETPDDVLEALARAALALGICGVRPLIFARAAARAAAALAGRDAVAEDDLALAARLTLGPRAVCLPPAAEDDEDATETPDAAEPDDSDGAGGEGETGDPRDLAEQVLEAARASLPAGLLDDGATSRVSAASAGRSGAAQTSKRRGRPIGSRPGRPEGGARLDLVATLRAAAPWQRLRRRERASDEADDRVIVRREDFRVLRLKERRRALTIFVVDASGSAALNRLAEAKGAVELLLAEAYVRRDEVALIAFRGAGAELRLPPTRSLARARRSLAGLPGGGGTPLASAIEAATLLAEAARRRGDAPSLVFLTDGQANVARDGTGGRARAQDEALAAARLLRARGHKALVIDVSPRPQPRARDISTEMGARYLPLPCADAASLARIAATNA